MVEQSDKPQATEAELQEMIGHMEEQQPACEDAAVESAPEE